MSIVAISLCVRTRVRLLHCDWFGLSTSTYVRGPIVPRSIYDSYPLGGRVETVLPGGLSHGMGVAIEMFNRRDHIPVGYPHT